MKCHVFIWSCILVILQLIVFFSQLLFLLKHEKEWNNIEAAQVFDVHLLSCMFNLITFITCRLLDVNRVQCWHNIDRLCGLHQRWMWGLKRCDVSGRVIWDQFNLFPTHGLICTSYLITTCLIIANTSHNLLHTTIIPFSIMINLYNTNNIIATTSTPWPSP